MGRYSEHLARRSWIEDLRQEVVKQADAIPDGWIDLSVKDDDTEVFVIRLPRIPFERWAFRTCFHRQNEWKNICPLGLKMHNDDPDHSDWWLATGIPFEYVYNHQSLPSSKNDLYCYEPGDPDYIPPDENEEELIKKTKLIESAAWNYSWNATYKRNSGVSFLAKTKDKIDGRIWHIKTVEDIPTFVEAAKDWSKISKPLPLIAVIPDSSVLYHEVIYHAGAIITCQGNKVAHMVTVARESKIPVIWCPDAFDKFFQWEKLKIENDRLTSS